MTNLICYFKGHSFNNPDKLLGIFPATPFCTRCGQYAGSPKQRIEKADDSEKSYSVRHQPLNDADTAVEIIDDLSLADALMLARNRAITYDNHEGRAQDIYFDDEYYLTIIQD